MALVDIVSQIAHAGTAAVLGRRITLASRNGDGLSGEIRDYFDAKHAILFQQKDGEPAVSDVVPYAIIRHVSAVAAIGRAPAPGDHVVVIDGLDAGAYEIEEVQPDGSGAYRCLARQVTS